MPGLDSPITVPVTVIAMAWQTAEGTTALTTNVQRVHADAVNIDPQVEHVHPGGTTGSQFEKDTHTKTTEIHSTEMERVPFLLKHDPSRFKRWRQSRPK